MKKKIIIAISAMLAIVSCQQMETEISEGYSDEVTFVINGTNQTKSTLGQALTDYWAAGDKVGVYCQETLPDVHNACFTAREENGSFIFSSPSAVVWSDESTYHNFHIYAPYSETASSDGIINNSLPCAQTAVSDGGLSVTGGTLIDNDLRYSNISSRKTYDGSLPLQEMRRQFGVIEFQIVCNDSSFDGKAITKVGFNPTEPISCGDYSFDLNTGDMAWGEETSREYTVSIEGLECPSTHNAVRSVYMLVPPGTNVGGFYYVIIDGVQYGIDRSSSSTVNVGAGQFYKVTMLAGDKTVLPWGKVWVAEYGDTYDFRTDGFVNKGKTLSYIHPPQVYISERVYYQNEGPYECTLVQDDTRNGHLTFNGQTVNYSVVSENKIKINGIEYELDSHPAPRAEYTPKELETALEDYSYERASNCFVGYRKTDKFFFYPSEGENGSWIRNVTFEAVTLNGNISVSVETLPVTPTLDVVLIEYSGYGNALILAKRKGLLGIGEHIVWNWHLWTTPDTGVLSGHVSKSLGGEDIFYQQGRMEPLYLNTWHSEVEVYKHIGGMLSDETYEECALNHYDKMILRLMPGFTFSDPHTFDRDWHPDRTWDGPYKSIYDPCPYGWRVPKSDDSHMQAIITSGTGIFGGFHWDIHYESESSYYGRRVMELNCFDYWSRDFNEAIELTPTGNYTLNFGTSNALMVRCVRD